MKLNEIDGWAEEVKQTSGCCDKCKERINDLGNKDAHTCTTQTILNRDAVFTLARQCAKLGYCPWEL